jgi:glutamate/tyrosine decarboxylase-like PLP-dependent enzyme
MKCLSKRGKTLHVYTPKIKLEPVPALFKNETMIPLREALTLREPIELEALKKLMSLIREHSVSTQSPYFMNQLFSGIQPQMLIAEEIIAQTKTTLATFEASPALSSIESTVIESLCELVGWMPGQRDGVSVPGGSAANFMALHCARQKYNPEIRKSGMNGEKFKVFVSKEAHYSFKKATVALGFGSDSLVLVPVDRHGKMDANALESLVLEHTQSGSIPLLVCATAGTTVLGAFDPIDALLVVCKKYKLWLHVDGAWGGPALFSEKLRPLMKGVEYADSVTFDAHKLFGASLTCSFLITQHSGLLLEANDVSGGDYLFHSDDQTLDRGKMSWQCGRRADALSFWSIWKSVGTAGLGRLVDRLIEVRKKVTKWIETEPRFELVGTPEYLNLCLRVRPPIAKGPDAHWAKRIREDLKDRNLAMVNYSADDQGDFLRLILAHPSLQFEHVKQILEWALEVE